MDLIFNMDKSEVFRWIVTIIIGGAGWAFALGRKMITSKVIEEAEQRFVKREIYELEMRSIQESIKALQLEQKNNHADFIVRLDKATDQLNLKIDKLIE